MSPELDFSNIDEIRATVEHCNQLPVHPRHPYVGDLVYTSFSGSHQDAIKKAFSDRRDGDIWDVPYLPIDPKDVGRSYEAVIRVNSQSGKGGIAYLLESEYGIEMPRRLQMEFSQTVQRVMDVAGKELTAADLYALFEREYGVRDDNGPHHQVLEEQGEGTAASVVLRAELPWEGDMRPIEGRGNGPIDAFIRPGQRYRACDRGDRLPPARHRRRRRRQGGCLPRTARRRGADAIRGRHRCQYHFGLAQGHRFGVDPGAGAGRAQRTIGG